MGPMGPCINRHTLMVNRTLWTAVFIPCFKNRNTRYSQHLKATA
jgi:hypothetical protein